tara:strand:+ start:448 stop:666 length:219 start_codon:yes stop_codon:yes gene_type:complete
MKGFSKPGQIDLVKSRIIELELEHRGLDSLIDANTAADGFDDLALRRLKKRRLQIRDEIIALKMGLVPDIPA